MTRCATRPHARQAGTHGVPARKQQGRWKSADKFPETKHSLTALRCPSRRCPKWVRPLLGGGDPALPPGLTGCEVYVLLGAAHPPGRLPARPLFSGRLPSPGSSWACAVPTPSLNIRLPAGLLPSGAGVPLPTRSGNALLCTYFLEHNILHSP